MQEQPIEKRARRWWPSDAVTAAAVAAVLLYAAAAGYRTLGDTDLPWQLRDARHLAQTGHIAGHDVFSYTAAGRPFTYPQGAGLIFYGLYRLGGYAALTWLSVFACAAAAGALLAVRPGLPAAAVTGLAVPLLAWRTSVRADLFTTLLFAFGVLLVLRGTARRHVWVLPALAVAWVNLHGAFMLAIGLSALLLLDAVIHREAVKKAALSAGLTVAATLLNPFGPGIWLGPLRQSGGTPFYRDAVSEWGPSVWSWWRFQELLEWRDPDGAYWVLLFIGIVALGAALWKRKWLLAGLLAPLAAASFYSIRFQALFAIAVAASAAELAPAARLRRSLRLAALAALLLTAGLRVYDLASNRYYFSRAPYSSFGAGLAYPFPERAAESLLRERLPGRLLHEYDLGGYLSWKLAPFYAVFVDGRTLPFGAVLLLESVRALGLRPGSAEWRQFMDRWGIRTIFYSLERHRPYGANLRNLCGSPDLRLVYLDELAAVFVLNTEENRPWIDRLGKSCATAVLPPRPPGQPEYLYHAQAAGVYHQLGRLNEAWAEIEQARRCFRADPELHIDAGQILFTRDADAARREFLAALRYRQSARAWYMLGMLEAAVGRHREAIAAYSRVTRNERYPYEAWRGMARSYLAMGEAKHALAWFQRTLEARDSLGGREALGNSFLADAYAGQAHAQFLLGDIAGTEASLQSAASTDPADPVPQLMLAEFYLGQKRAAEAGTALARAVSLGATGPAFENLRRRLSE